MQIEKLDSEWMMEIHNLENNFNPAWFLDLKSKSNFLIKNENQLQIQYNKKKNLNRNGNKFQKYLFSKVSIIIILILFFITIYLPYKSRKFIPNNFWEKIELQIVNSFIKLVFFLSGVMMDKDQIGSKFNRKIFETINIVVPPTFPNFKRKIRSRDVILNRLSKFSKHFTDHSSIHDVKVRLFEPHKDLLNREKSPLLIYFHGGGHVLQHVWDIEQSKMTEKLARLGSLYVLSVEYRLAPEHTYPANINDMKQVVDWVAREFHYENLNQNNNTSNLNTNFENINQLPNYIDWNNIIIGGDSAGGQLATSACLYTRKKYPSILPYIKKQLLIYPSYMLLDTDSHKKYSNKFVLNESNMHFFIEAYSGFNITLIFEEIFKDPFVNPLNGNEGLKKLPPAYFIIPGLDPLQDDSYILSKYLKYEDVPVEIKEYPTMGHGFISMSIFSKSEEAINDFISHLRKHEILKNK